MNNPVSELAAEKKAQELIKTFSISLYGDYTEGVNEEHPRRCAAICVLELIEEEKQLDELLDSEYSQATKHPTFWQQVLTQINKS